LRHFKAVTSAWKSGQADRRFCRSVKSLQGENAQAVAAIAKAEKEPERIKLMLDDAVLRK
jgi:hypothetical protein